MPYSILSILTGLLLLASAGSRPALGLAPQDEFTLEPWPGDWGEVVGIEAVGDGRFVAWDRGGIWAGWSAPTDSPAWNPSSASPKMRTPSGIIH